MRPHRFASLLIFATACGRSAVERAPVAPVTTVAAMSGATSVADAAVIARIIRLGIDSSQVASDLRYLMDVIGPRLTGSDAMRVANVWTAGRFRTAGVDTAWLEPYPFGQPWERGPISVRLVSPHARTLPAASWAWAPGTAGPQVGTVVAVDAGSEVEFRRLDRAALRGAWILMGPPVGVGSPTSAERAFRRHRLVELLADAGIAGTIIDGEKPNGLFTMSGSPRGVMPFPQVVVGRETYRELYRASASPTPARIEVNVQNTMRAAPVVQWNTVAEIRGSDLRDELVILGAHLDSWDLGTGATDNGAASVAVLEAARLLRAGGARPRRTIRFVLFSGEEQGLLGSEAHVRAHHAILERIQAVVVLDNGAGPITGIALQGHDHLDALWRVLFAPLAALAPSGAMVVRSARKGGTDHLPFDAVAVPAFNYDQLTRAYDLTHHSQLDVLDNVIFEDVAQAATVMAVNALQLANLPTRLPAGRRD